MACTPTPKPRPAKGGGDQGQGIEFELMFNAQVSKQVEIGGRIHSRFNKNFWSNYGGFAVSDSVGGNEPDGACSEWDPRCNQYIKLRGAWARITPGYEWMDSATIGNSDWGMFDAWTQGKSRYIDRDNIGGVLLQGSAFDRTLRWDLARVTLAQYQGLSFSTGRVGTDNIYANDANWIAQAKYTPGPDWNATLIAMYAQGQRPRRLGLERPERRHREHPLGQHGRRAEGPVHRARLHGSRRLALLQRLRRPRIAVRPRRLERRLPVQPGAAP